MQSVRNIVARLGVAGAIAAVSVIPASAFEVYVGPRHHHHYYDYYGGGNAAGRVGRYRAASVSRIAMVHGTSMEGGRALGIFTIWRPLRRPSLLLRQLRDICRDVSHLVL